MTGRRVAVAAAGVLGAEFLGAAGFAAGASLLAFDLAGPAVAAIILAPILAAAGGPAGYDLATWWANDEDRAARGEPGARAAVHVAGTAFALVVLLVCVLLAAAAPALPTVYLVLVALGGLPIVAVAGRRFALRFAGSSTLLPASLVAVVGLGLGLFLGYIAFIMRMFDVHGGD